MSRTIAPSSSQARLILIGTALLLTLGMGIRQSFGLFLAPVTHDLAVTAADFTLALAVQNIVWGLSQALVGATADRFGLRITMMAGAAIYVVGLCVMPAAQGALALIISGGLMGVALSCTATSLAMTACVRAVSPARRSQMLGVVAAAGSLGTLVAPLVTQAVLALIGGLVAEIFGTRYMATLLGLSFVVHQAGSSLGAWGAGLIFDLFGSYDPAWQIGTLIGFAAGVVQILAGGPTRRQDRMIATAVATA
jgi:MFS family permease